MTEPQWILHTLGCWDEYEWAGLKEEKKNVRLTFLVMLPFYFTFIGVIIFVLGEKSLLSYHLAGSERAAMSRQ